MTYKDCIRGLLYLVPHLVPQQLRKSEEPAQKPKKLCRSKFIQKNGDIAVELDAMPTEVFIVRLIAEVKIRVPARGDRAFRLVASVACPSSFQRGGSKERMRPFLPCLAQNWQVGVSILPRREEILPSLLALRPIARERRRASQSEVRERVQRRERRVASVIKNLLELRRRFRPTPQFQVSLAAQVLRPEFSGGFIARCGFQLLNCPHRITTL